MALMKYREPNQVQWVGVRPAHKGTQILKRNDLAGSGNTPVYTVPAGVNLFITYATLTSRHSAAAAAGSNISVQAIGEGAAVVFLALFFDAIGQLVATATFNPPIEVATGKPITLLNSSVALDSSATIHGWIEDA